MSVAGRPCGIGRNVGTAPRSSTCRLEAMTPTLLTTDACPSCLSEHGREGERTMGRLEGKVAVVTGGGAGIGRASAFAFAREGARVAVVDVASDTGNETVRLIRESGGEAHFVCCDVIRATEVEAMIDAVVERYGRLDCAYNNAGIEGISGTTADCTEENWDRIFAVNVRGVW